MVVLTSYFFTFTSAARAEVIDVTSGDFESYRALKDGNTYRFVESVTFAAPSGESALKVADGATVTLIIPSGVEVSLTGGSANGTTGAGAGIEVPAGAGGNVTINGGTVTANGGWNGAGIGGGKKGAGGTVVINGGMVMARGGRDSAGIGGGYKGNAGEVTPGENVKCFEGAVGNDCQYVKIGEKPTCEGGEIEWNGAANAWVVTPNAGVTEVSIIGLPDGDTVAVPPTVTQVNGVDDVQIRVKSGTYDITGAFTISGGAIQLDENGVVTIGGETIPVKPTILLRQGYGGQVGDSGVSVTMRTIPGLKYTLVRGAELGAITMTVVEPTLATEAQMTLTDAEPPTDKAFYRIDVSVP